MENALKYKQELLQKDYGSSAQKLVDYVTNLPDKAERTEKIKLLVEMMIRLNPGLKFTENYEHKILGDFYTMSGQKLDVDIEFEKPDVQKYFAKPQKVAYNRVMPKFKHYGENIELLIKELAKKDDAIVQENIQGVGKLMKTFYKNWNKEGIDDVVIAKQMAILSEGKITVSEAMLSDENTNFDSQRVHRPNNNNHHHRNRPNNPNQNNNPNSKNNNNNNNRNRKPQR